MTAIAEAGGFTRAAEQLYLAQPSLSVQVRKLEKELGVTLFERLGRRVTLTAAGEAFLEHVRPALFHLERARAETVAVRDLGAGGWWSAPSRARVRPLLPMVLADYRQAYPEVELRLVEHNVSAEFERMVQVGELDLAVLRAPWGSPRDHRTAADPRADGAMLPPGHRLAGPDELDLAELPARTSSVRSAAPGCARCWRTAAGGRGSRRT